MYNQYVICIQGVMGGKPCIAGTRITVTNVLDMISSGMSNNDIISDFPQLDEIKIKAAVKFSAFQMRKGNAA